MAVNNGDVIEVTVEGSIAGQDNQNVYTLQCLTASPISDADALDDLLEIFEALALIIKALYSVSYAFNRIRAINRTQDADLGVADFVTTTNGDQTGTVYPLQIAAIISLVTDKFRTVGRKFWGPGSATTYSTQGALAAGAITAATNAIAHLVSTHQPDVGVWSYGVVSTVDELFHPFEAGSTSTYAGTQRRRRHTVGS